MKATVKYIFILFSIIYLAYLALPTPEFPAPPPDSLQSQEPADTEIPLRRAYFTDYTREEVLMIYQGELKSCGIDLFLPSNKGMHPLGMQGNQIPSSFFERLRSNIFCEFPFLTYRLNYPPEEAYGIIRDQTRSTFLEEIVHPFRESLFVNGFEPKVEKDAINIDGRHWRQKITVKWVPSNLFARLFVGIVTLVCIYIVYNAFASMVKKLKIKNKNDN